MDQEYNYETRSIDCQVGDQVIRGTAFIPEGKGPFPLLIFAHGLGGTYRSGLEYADLLVPKGVAVYTFDFRGGSAMSLSDGVTTDMSIMTEARDLETVLENARKWEFVDPDRIVLLGESQGGMIAAMTASRHPDDISGLVLFYPALMIPDSIHQEFPTFEDIPDTQTVLGTFPAGRPYAEDAWDFDIFPELPKFTKPVLIAQGDMDQIVPPAYAERAEKTYPDADLHVIHGAGHGFVGEQLKVASALLLDYLEEIGIL